MMLCALTFAADMAAGLTEVEEKNLRRNEMLGNVVVDLAEWGSLMRDSSRTFIQLVGMAERQILLIIAMRCLKLAVRF